MTNVEYMPLSRTNGPTVVQWLGGKGIDASVEPDDRLRIKITESVTVQAAASAGHVTEATEADVLVRPGIFLVATYVEVEKRYFIRVTDKAPKPGEDEPASVG